MKKKRADKESKNKKGIFKKILKIMIICAIAGMLAVAVCNIIVIASASKHIVDFETAVSLDDVDCIIVLGAGVKEDGSLSNILRERVTCGADLYLSGASDRLLLSGDHSREDYNEVGAMKSYMVSRGINGEAVFTDHAGFDTYDTMYRAREVFKAERVLIVTQDFHIARAVFIARSLGLDAYGVECDTGELGNNLLDDLREVAARTKYVFDAIFKPKPKYLGEAIPIWGEASLSDG